MCPPRTPRNGVSLGQKGISVTRSFRVCSRSKTEVIVFGTYSKCVGMWKDGPLCSLKTDSGVTQVEFSPCGTKLYTAVRRSNDFLCWDLRNPGVVLYSARNGWLRQRIRRIRLSDDCINGVNMHKSLPILATSSGQRLCEHEERRRDNSVRLWFYQNMD